MTNTGAESDPLADEFISDLERLSPEQWIQICRRHAADQEAMTAADEKAAGILAEIAMGGLSPNERQKYSQLAKSRSARCRALTGSLPESYAENGKSFPLQQAARAAVRNALQALNGYEEMMKRPGGRTLVGTLLEPFRGFATLPKT
jgi:anti-sigma factor RsiW